MRYVSDPEFNPPAQIPFRPGESPFRQKGTAYIGDLEYFAAKVPGGSGAVLRAVADAPTRAFLSQRFVASDWYDAYPNLAMQLAAARLSGLSFEEHRRRVGGFHATALGGLYRALLRVVSNENVAIWGPRAAALYWNFGRTVTTVAGPNEVTAVRYGTPKGLLRWFAWAAVGFADATLRLAGAKEASTTTGEVEADGEQAGQELCSLRMRMVWK
jgi:hypothetical protein